MNLYIEDCIGMTTDAIPIIDNMIIARLVEIEREFMSEIQEVTESDADNVNPDMNMNFTIFSIRRLKKNDGFLLHLDKMIKTTAEYHFTMQISINNDELISKPCIKFPNILIYGSWANKIRKYADVYEKIFQKFITENSRPILSELSNNNGVYDI